MFYFMWLMGMGELRKYRLKLFLSLFLAMNAAITEWKEIIVQERGKTIQEKLDLMPYWRHSILVAVVAVKYNRVIFDEVLIILIKLSFGQLKCTDLSVYYDHNLPTMVARPKVNNFVDCQSELSSQTTIITPLRKIVSDKSYQLQKVQ